MGGWTNLVKIGQVFAHSATMQNYFPCANRITDVPNYPWSIDIRGSTDHSSTGGIYVSGLPVGANPLVLANYETYNQAVARGAFDYLVTKPAANPIYTDTDSGYSSTETPSMNKVGSEWLMTAQVGVTGANQPTLLARSTDLINFTNNSPFFVIDGTIDDDYPAKDQHRGYLKWGANPFAGVAYNYVGYGLHGGGDKPLNAFYGSNDGATWTIIAIVADYIFPDNPDVPAGWGIWWNGMDVRGVRDAGGGEYSMIVSLGDLNHGGAGRQSKMYEIFLADDGITVTRQPRLIMDVGEIGSPDSDEISSPSFVNYEGQWLMYYQAANAGAQNSTMLATLDWDETLEKPAPISRPNHKKYVLKASDGAYPAEFSTQAGTPSFLAGGIECTSNERIQLTQTFVPDDVGYVEILTTQSGNGTSTARLINTITDAIASSRAVNGVEMTTYTGGVGIQEMIAGATVGTEVSTAYPVTQNDKKVTTGIRWDVANDELYFLVGKGACKNKLATTSNVNTALSMKAIFGNINFGTISIDEVVVRVGTSANDGIAPEVLGVPVGTSDTVLFTFSEACIGDGQGIVVKNNGTPVAGTFTRASETTLTFTRESGVFTGTLTYDITSTDVRNADLVQILNVSDQPIDFTPAPAFEFDIEAAESIANANSLSIVLTSTISFDIQSSDSSSISNSLSIVIDEPVIEPVVFNVDVCESSSTSNNLSILIGDHVRINSFTINWAK